MKDKKNFKGCVGNIVDSVLSDPIMIKNHTEELPSSVDSINRIVEHQPLKEIRSQKKKKRSKKRKLK